MTDLLLLDRIVPWFQPLWVLIVCAAVLTVAFGLIQLVIFLISRRAAGFVWGTAKEVLMQPWLGICFAIAVVILGLFCGLWAMGMLAAWVKPVWLVIDGAIAIGDLDGEANPNQPAKDELVIFSAGCRDYFSREEPYPPEGVSILVASLSSNLTSKSMTHYYWIPITWPRSSKNGPLTCTEVGDMTVGDLEGDGLDEA